MERNISYNLRYGNAAKLPKVQTPSLGVKTIAYFIKLLVLWAFMVLCVLVGWRWVGYFLWAVSLGSLGAPWWVCVAPGLIGKVSLLLSCRQTMKIFQLFVSKNCKFCEVATN